MRIRTHQRERSQFIARIGDAAVRDLFGFPQWSTHADDDGVMFVDPRFPRRHPCFFLRTAIGFGKGVPGRSPRT